MNLQPLNDRVIVKRLAIEKPADSVIVLLDDAKERPDQGEVIAVGPGLIDAAGVLRKLTVRVGHTVLFGKYSGQTVKLDGDELLVMKEDDLFAIVNL